MPVFLLRLLGGLEARPRFRLDSRSSDRFCGEWILDEAFGVDGPKGKEDAVEKKDNMTRWFAPDIKSPSKLSLLASQLKTQQEWSFLSKGFFINTNSSRDEDFAWEQSGRRQRRQTRV